MATAHYRIAQPHQGSLWVFGWHLTSGETGDAVFVGHLLDKTLQLYGQFGAGSLALEGACDPDTPVYATLRDRPGTLVTGIGAAYLEVIDQNVCLVRPVATLGVTLVHVRLVCVAPRSRTA